MTARSVSVPAVMNQMVTRVYGELELNVKVRVSLLPEISKTLILADLYVVSIFLSIP